MLKISNKLIRLSFSMCVGIFLFSPMLHAQDADGGMSKYSLSIDNAVEKIKLVKSDSTTTLIKKSDKVRKILADERAGYRTLQRNAKAKYLGNLSTLDENATEEEIGEVKATYETDQLTSLRNRNNAYSRIYSMFEYDRIRWFPSRNTKFSSLYYNELRENSSINFLRNQTLIFGDNIGAIASEIISGHAAVFRLSLSTALSKVVLNDIDTEELSSLPNDQVQAFVNKKNAENLANATLANVVAGGGQLTFKTQYPILNINGRRPLQPQIDSEIVLDINGQFSALGTSLPENEAMLWGGAGSQTRFFLPFVDFSKDNNTIFSKFGVFAEYDFHWIKGSGAFNTNLQVDNPFWMGQFKCGIFANGIQINYTRLNFTANALDGKYQNIITLAFAPQRL